MSDEHGMTEPGGPQTETDGTADAARKLKARELNELVRYTMWSVFRVADRTALKARQARQRRGRGRRPA